LRQLLTLPVIVGVCCAILYQAPMRSIMIPLPWYFQAVPMFVVLLVWIEHLCTPTQNRGVKTENRHPNPI
jgi:hypothetical protein